MNAVPLTPAEIKARNERARKIAADHRAKARDRQIAKARLDKDSRVRQRVEEQANRNIRFMSSATHVQQHSLSK